MRSEIVPATLAHARELSAKLRPFEATLGAEDAVARSFFSLTWLVDGEVGCIVGLGKVGDKIIPWLLGTDLMEKHSRHFLRGAKACFQEMLSQHPRFDGVLDTSNPKALRWLKYLGCTISDEVFAVPALDRQFRLFHIENSTHG